jgi:hypothetical protein
MRSKLALPALLITSLLGATAVASAQTQPAPGATSDSKMAPATAPKKMVKTSKMKSDATTGMSSGARKSHKADKDNMSK